jgi:hypothetical protein
VGIYRVGIFTERGVHDYMSRDITVGRGRIKLRSSHRSARISLRVSHRGVARTAMAVPMFGRCDDEDEVRRPAKRRGNRGKTSRMRLR